MCLVYIYSYMYAYSHHFYIDCVSSSDCMQYYCEKKSALKGGFMLRSFSME